MTKGRISVVVAVVCLLCTVGLRAQSAPAAGSDSEAGSGAGVVPRVIKYSGAINPQAVPQIAQSTENESANNAGPTVVSLTFSLYELQDGGGPLWSETQKVQVDQHGRYAVILGATVSEGLPLDLFTSGKALWLGVQPELPGAVEQPRVLLVAVPYALKASDSDTLGGKPASAYALAGSVLGVVTGSPTSAPPATGVAPSPALITSPQASLQAGTQSNNSSRGVNNTATGVDALINDTTGSNNTADGYGALFTNTTGYFNTGVGEAALTFNTTGYYDTANGGAALFYNTTGSSDTASGAGALQDNTTGSNNTASGALSLFVNTTGSGNTATGYNAGLNLTGGSSNIMEGSQAGVNFKSTESNNIDIGNQGVTGESGVIRVGTPGTQTATYIAGITGVTPSGSPLPVVINSSGQLGTGASAVGTVTSVGSGTGLTGGPITSTGTLSVDETVIATNASVTSAVAGGVTTAETYTNNTFLPLAGGTLTGGLAGTTASFSSVNSASPYQIGGGNVLSVDSSSNVFVGSPEPASNTGSSNTASGYQALFSNGGGASNTASGYEALYSNTGSAGGHGHGHGSTGSNNTASGYEALYSNTTGNNNSASGYQALYSNTGTDNSASGYSALYSNTTGSYNTGIGENALWSNTTGSNNTAVGNSAGSGLGIGSTSGVETGSGNIFLGYLAGFHFGANESDNIIIGSSGVALDSNVIRIGETTAVPNGCQYLPCQTATYIAGINGATGLSNPVPVVIDPVTGQLGAGTSGVTTITPGTDITTSGTGNVTIGVNAGAFDPSGAASTAQANAISTAEGFANTTFLPLAGGTLTGPLNSTSPYQIGGTNVLSFDGNMSANVFVGTPEPASNTGIYNTAVGFNALEDNNGGSYNTAAGLNALAFNGTGNGNTGFGTGALSYNGGGSGNTAVGNDALGFAGYNGGQAPNNNTAVGSNAGVNLGTVSSVGGSSNIMLGYNAGFNYDGALGDESNNIDIGNLGVEGDGASPNPGVIRIGLDANQDSNCANDLACQSSTYIAGISGVSIAGGSTVVINSLGQLGTVPSSRRYKEDIRDMGAASDGLLRLRPVTFRYKKPLDDGSKPVQYGLIAEEVAEVYPDLVARNKDGQIETVQYYKLDAMLLNEIQKLSRAHTADQAEMQKLSEAHATDQAAIARLQSQVAEQGQEQQAAMTQLLAKVHGIQLSLASGRSTHSGRPHPRVARTAAHRSTNRATNRAAKSIIQPEVKHLSTQPVSSLVAKVCF